MSFDAAKHSCSCPSAHSFSHTTPHKPHSKRNHARSSTTSMRGICYWQTACCVSFRGICSSKPHHRVMPHTSTLARRPHYSHTHTICTTPHSQQASLSPYPFPSCLVPALPLPPALLSIIANGHLRRLHRRGRRCLRLPVRSKPCTRSVRHGRQPSAVHGQGPESHPRPVQHLPQRM